MDFEARSLKLLFEVHEELSKSLNSLGGKSGDGYVDNFKFWSSVYMGHVSQGFIYLRKVVGLEESRFLVRPAIELMLKEKAITVRPDLIYRLGRTETRSDRAWLIGLAKQAGATFDEKAFDRGAARPGRSDPIRSSWSGERAGGIEKAARALESEVVRG